MATYSLDEVMGGKKTYSLEEVTGNQEPIAGGEAVSSLKKIPRQLGLTARYGVEGLADTVGIFADPLAVLSNKTLGTHLKPLRGATSDMLDNIGLPNPENAQERVVGDASRLLAGTGGIIKGVTSAANVFPKAATSLLSLGSRPELQAASAIGAGYAGGTAREQGADPGGQFGAALAGGLVLPAGVAGISSVAKSGMNALKNNFSPQQIDIQVENVIKQAGVDMATMPTMVKNNIRQDVQKALQTGDQLSPDAVRRLADYRAVGATPMRGNVTLSPIDITQDKNLAKLGANSRDPVANQLANIQNKNNSTLISGLNELGANSADDAYSAGKKVIGALSDKDAGAKTVINNLYSDARATNGRSALIDHVAFTNQANNLLDDALLGGKLPSDVRNLLNKTAAGEMPLTVDVAEQFKTRIGSLQRASNDPAERMALGQVRQALDDAPLIDGQGKQALDAFNKARFANKSYMNVVEKTPALKAVRDGVEPDKFVQQFILGNGSKSNVMDVAMMKKNIRGNKEAMGAVRGQILAHLKGKGVSGAADEVANFSPSGYNKALTDIGDRKLKLFFDKNEIEQMKRIGRVASYENVQPKGSAVNNSNSAAAIFSSVIDGIGQYVPFGKSLVADPIQNISLSINARRALNTPQYLTTQTPKTKLPPPMWPLLGGGLLGSEN